MWRGGWRGGRGQWQGRLEMLGLWVGWGVWRLTGGALVSEAWLVSEVRVVLLGLKSIWGLRGWECLSGRRVRWGLQEGWGDRGHWGDRWGLRQIWCWEGWTNCRVCEIGRASCRERV